MTRNKKTIAAIIAIILIAFLLMHYVFAKPAAGPAAGGPPGAPPPTKVEAVKVGTEKIAEKLDIVGSLTSNESATVSSEINGRVVGIPFKEGSEIKKGDVIFKLDDSVQKAELAKANANLELAQNNVKRYGDLIKSGAISKVQYEQSQADLNLGGANIALAKANLDKTTIRAPFSGIAGIRQVSIGNVVAIGQKLVNLEQMAPIRAQFTVPEKYLTQVKVGQKVTITNESYPDEKFEGTVFAIDPRVDPTNRSVTVQATSPNADRKLYPGQFVSVNMPLSTSRDAVMVPDQALVPEAGANSVFEVVDGKAKKVEVKIGMRVNNKVEIISGVNNGDMVVTAGQLKIGDGMPVRAVEPTPVKVREQDEEDEKKVLSE